MARNHFRDDPDWQSAVQALNEKVDRMHADNQHALRELRDTVTNHVMDETGQLSRMRQMIEEHNETGTEALRRIEHIVASFQAMLTVGKWIRGGVGWLAAVLVSIALIAGVVLHWFGHGPLPPLSP
jgi:hypothetical protein